MINFTCFIGLHKFEPIGVQYGPHNTVYGLSQTRAARMIEICKKCKQINKIEFDISSNVKNDETIEWSPPIQKLIKRFNGTTILNEAG